MVTTDEVSKSTTWDATTSVPTPKETNVSSKHDALEHTIYKIGKLYQLNVHVL